MRTDWVARAGVGVLVLVGMVSALIEITLVPLYVGAAVVPVAVVLTLVLNVALPRLARRLVDSTPVSSLPFLGWLGVVIVFGLPGRPEGDVVLPGGGALEYVTYGVILGGAFAGTVGVVSAIPPPPDSRAGRARASRQSR